MMNTRQLVTTVTIFFTLSLPITAKTSGDSQIPAKVFKDEMHVSEEPMKQRLRKNGMKLKGKRIRYVNTGRHLQNEEDEREKTARRRAKKCPSKGPLSKKCNGDNDSSNASDTSSSTTEGDTSGSTSETSSVSSAEDNGADNSENSDSENNDSSIGGSAYDEGAETNNDEENINGNDNDNANDNDNDNANANGNGNGNGNDNDATSNVSHLASVNYDKYDNDTGERSTTNGGDVYNQYDTNGDDTQAVGSSIQSGASSPGETVVEKFESKSAKMWGIIAASCSLIVALVAMAVYKVMTPKDDQGKEVPLTAASDAKNKKGGSRNTMPVADDGSDLFYVRV